MNQDSQSVVVKDGRTCKNLLKPNIPKEVNEVTKIFSPSCFPRNTNRKFGYSQSRDRVETAPLPLPVILNFFRTVVGRFKTLSQMLAPHLRRQSSRYREAQSSVW